MAITFVSPTAVNAAYQAASRIGGEAAQAGAANAGSSSFSNALADAVKGAVNTMHTGESAAMQGAAGKGDVVQVVNAVTSAELTLETVVAIRDKVISAYQDIMRMPI
jgi:flagellar hook-basal body complex protein FliE